MYYEHQCIKRKKRVSRFKKKKKARSRQYFAKTFTDTDYRDSLLANTLKPNLCCIAWSRQQEALVSTWTKMKVHVFTQDYGKLLKLVDQFIYLSSNISSTESSVNIYIDKAWTAIKRLIPIWKSDLLDKMKWKFFQLVVLLSVLLYGCTMWIFIKILEKKLGGNCIRILYTVLNKPCKHQAVGPLTSHLTSHPRKTCWALLKK